MSKYIGLALVAFVMVSTGYGDDFTGARPLGLGRTFVGVADDANALDWNPAGIASFQSLSLTAGFNKLYLGLDNDNIGIGHFGVVNQYLDWFAYGVSWRSLFSHVYSENHFRLGLAHRFGWKPETFFGRHPLCVGLAVKAIGIGYNPANFEDNPDDPGGMSIEDDLRTNLGGISKWGFSVDAGLLWRLTPKITVGVTTADLIQPDMAMQDAAALPESVRAELENAGKLPLHLRFGASYAPNMDLLFAGDVRYFKEGSAIITPHLGAEKWFNMHSIAVRGGFNIDELAFGLGWRLNREWALQIDYAFVYPLSKLAAAGANSHKFSAMFQIPNPIPIWDLAAISVSPQMARLKAGDEVTVTTVFKNTSGKRVKKANYSIYSRKPDGTYAIVDKGTIEDFGAGKEAEVTFAFKDFQPGEYTIFAAIDDDGSDIPRLVGNIEEMDEGNNVASEKINIFPPPTPTISFKEDTLYIVRTAFQETEEPVIPILFFDTKSIEILPRYQRILDRIAIRLNKNPDVVVRIAGFYDGESDGKDNSQIGQQREDAVYNYLVAKVGNSNQVIKDTENDPAQLRAGGGERYLGIEKYLPMIQQENRRVELVAQMPSLTLQQVERVIEFSSGQTDKQVDFSAQAMTYKSILERNPDVMLLLEGYAVENEGPNYLEPAFIRAANLKQQVKTVVPFYLWDRVFAWGDDRHPADQAHVKISLLADGILFKPFEGRKFPKGETIQNPENFVQFSVKSDNKVMSHRAELLDLSGKKIKQYLAGEGEPPAGTPWDWGADDGGHIVAGNYYVGHLSVTDELGAAGEAYSETLVVNQVDKVIGIETMLMIVFEFDEDVAISGYYHSRMEAVSRRFIELAEHETEELVVAVTGHTDIIGLSRRNMELSMERSTRELTNLKIYMRHILNLSDEAALDKWLADRNVKLVAEGHGPERPYTLKKVTKDGEIEEMLLGDNDLPEGREINRRVIVEFRSKKPTGR